MSTEFRTLMAWVLTAIMVLASPMAAASQSGALPLRTPSPSGSYLAGLEAMRDLRTAEAARFFLDAAEQDWDNPLLVENAFIALAADGRIASAADLAKRLLDFEPRHELARLILGVVAIRERRYVSAGQTLGPVGAGTLIGISGIALRAWARVGRDDLDGAFALLDRFARSGLNEFLLFHRALMADVAGDRTAARQLSARAYEADPFVTRIVEAHIRIFANSGQFEAAKKIIDTFEAEGLIHPLITALHNPVTEQRRPGKFAPDVQTGAAELLLGMGAVLLRDGSSDIGMVFLELARYLAPENETIALTIAGQFEAVERFRDANFLYESISASSPLKAAATVSLAENLSDLGDTGEAIRRLRNIVAIRPHDLDATSALADLLRADGQYLEAAAAYSSALAILGGEHPRDWRYFYVRGISYERAGEWEKAEPDFLRALELNPGQPQVLNYLGYTWVDMGVNLNNALDMIERAVAANPTDGYIVDSLGWAFYKLGRYAEAIDVLEQAVRLRPNDAEINDHLGDAYWRSGRTLEAGFQWTIASDVDTKGNVRERVAPKFENGLDAPAGSD